MYSNSNMIELVEELRHGDKKASTVVQNYLDKIEELDSKVNGFINVNENAVEEAEELEGTNKPLAGMPIAVKDNVEVRGLRTTYGSKLFEDNVSEQDSVIVERLKKAGAVIIGKTNLPEFALIAYTDSPVIGETSNPWNMERTVGGSSGGSAAAVLSGMAPAATGNDGGGSIRIPASFCGLYGLKPSYGRVPSYPEIPLFMGLHSEGFLTRRVEDTAFLLDLTKGEDIRDIDSLPEDESYQKVIEDPPKSPKIAFSPDLGYATVDQEVENIVTDAAFSLEQIGQVEKIDIDIPNLEEELIKKIVVETISFLEDKIEEWKNQGFPPYKPFIEMAEEINLNEYINITERKQELWKSLRPIFEEYDFLLTPTVSVPPFELGDISVDKINGQDTSTLGWMPFTYPFNFTKQPAASIPAGFTKDDLPVGLQIVGRHYDDSGVLRISKEYQSLNPWQDKYSSIDL